MNSNSETPHQDGAAPTTPGRELKVGPDVLKALRLIDAAPSVRSPIRRLRGWKHTKGRWARYFVIAVIKACREKLLDYDAAHDQARLTRRGKQTLEQAAAAERYWYNA